MWKRATPLAVWGALTACGPTALQSDAAPIEPEAAEPEPGGGGVQPVLAIAGTGASLAPSVEAPPPPQPDCDPPETLDVLFIGNSYMLMHDLPSLVSALGEASGVEVDGELLAMGGKDFEYHLARKQTRKRLEDNDWDFVILQSHSLDPVRNRDGFLEAGEELVALVRDSGAQPLLFETWARDAENRIYRFGRAGYSPDEMQEMVHDAYAELARRSGAEVIDVGAAWLATREEHPDIDLYASDLAHPNKTGSYLTAEVIFTALTGLSPVGAGHPALGVEPTDARRLRRQAADIIEPECELDPTEHRAVPVGHRE